MVSIWPINLKHHEVDWQKAYRYAKALEDGAVFPPIIVKQLPDGKLKVFDGAHRTVAHKLLGKHIEAYLQD